MTPRYIAGRAVQGVFVLWAAYTLSFFVLYWLPGDPISIMASGGLMQGQVDEEAIARLTQQYGFDQPILVQYLTHLLDALRGDLGVSVLNGAPVVETIVDALGTTLVLGTASVAVAVVVGFGLGLAAAFSRPGWLQNVILAIPSAGVSLPTFWVGLVLVQIFAFQLGWFPAFGLDDPSGLVLPALTLGVPTGAIIGQIFTSSLLDELRQPYAETARAKGASHRQTVVGHAVRNAVGPALSIAGVVAGSLLAGAVVVETVFSLDGVGRIAATAVQRQDIPLVQGVVVLGAIVFVVVSFVADLVHARLDPRVTLSRQAQAA